MTETATRFPYRTKALRIRQELAECFVAALPARLLLDVCFSDVLTAEHTDDTKKPYVLGGTQREQREKRLQEVGRYIDRDDTAFPNSIILAANSRPSDGTTEDAPDDQADEDAEEEETGESEVGPEDRNPAGIDRRWRIEVGDDGCHELVIPSESKLAAVVDGQHRLFGFTKAEVLERLDMDMICTIYLDLPKSFQAQIFATINSNQKPVDKSLTYEMFGYNIDDEDPSFWSPDKLAVFLTRRLGSDEGSPLKGRIVIAPKKDAALAALTGTTGWKVSTAVIVEGIARLLTSNPKSDANSLQTPRKVRRVDIRDRRKDRSPLREAYFNGQDVVIYTMVLNYLTACNELFWALAPVDSFIYKTVGVQALFDILRKLAPAAYETKVISVDHFRSILKPAEDLDFTEDRFRNASGSGRSIIRRAIEEEIGLGR
ncbi:DGQHR domain-containing protein [Sphingomonas ginsenosidivorax]|uniref:DGQHR domain-containing protein n=1 Tax=Sphingomonas ginsenosidivorax TaxID=862135 RepID=A0A5C6UFV7_9SPHN|nr:DGQHR domain-containing protein [Sphingomonas ginsenosidivorax]TXC71320.1 DGQHR domain-containing protein [Sphingomonas ginsenosidivorax]